MSWSESPTRGTSPTSRKSLAKEYVLKSPQELGQLWRERLSLPPSVVELLAFFRKDKPQEPGERGPGDLEREEQ